MITISHELAQLKKQLDPAHLASAEKSALKSIQRKVATQISRLVRHKYNVTARSIAARLKLSLVRGDTEAHLWYVGTRVGLINFGGQFKKVRTSKGERMGATAKMTKQSGRFLTKGGFIATGRNGNVHIFQRRDLKQNSRFPLRAKTGPAIPQMVSEKETIEAASKFVEQQYPAELTNRLNFFLQKQMQK